MSAFPLYGLVLAGGLSTRMHRDKAALKYQGKTQLDRAFELAGRHVAKVFVSVRADQTLDPTRAQRPMILDSVAGEGPIVGIRSALAAHPQVAWLVLACDLPFLSDAAIGYLVRERDSAGSAAFATAYKSAHDGLPEPLCAIWEPAAAQALADYQAGGGHCPRKFLIRHGARLLEPQDARALDNVNTPEEYTQALSLLDNVTSMQLKIQYYALMREQAGRSEETIETSASTPAGLYEELVARYGFTLSREQLKVAVNSEFSDWSRPLKIGDAVVFIPPVAGG
ncbi:MAG: NTP transferase domain-containing protein [Pseudomonadota bacterium]|nr:NTP transferase domain-containing protein [Pseudomonadota bacterium]